MNLNTLSTVRMLEELERRMHLALAAINAERAEKTPEFSLESYSVARGDVIDLVVIRFWYGEDDRDFFSFPSALLDAGDPESLRAHVAQVRADRAEARERAEAERREKEERQRRAQFEKLKQEFEPETPSV